MWTYDQASDEHARGRHRGIKRIGPSTYLRAHSDNGRTVYIIRYHDTDIVTFHQDGSYTLNTDGFRTYSTKRRLKMYTPAFIRQTAFKWFVIANGKGYDFEDGMTIDSLGNPIVEGEVVGRPEREVGKIEGFEGHWGSGIAILVVRQGDGLKRIPCENGPTVRALDAMFHGIITDGHRVDVEALVGKFIAFETDAMGMLSSIEPD